MLLSVLLSRTKEHLTGMATKGMIAKPDATKLVEIFESSMKSMGIDKGGLSMEGMADLKMAKSTSTSKPPWYMSNKSLT